MRVVVKQKDGNTREFQFTEGPVSIGRGANSHVFLPDRAVSRQHAIIHCADDGKWTIEDLGSSNKTYLNDKAIRRAEIKHGDCLRITDFIIEIVMCHISGIDFVSGKIRESIELGKKHSFLWTDCSQVWQNGTRNFCHFRKIGTISHH